ncbi:hypothetical protein Taro_028131 [Colocasia esculenta]|uniref:Uncharacterized protein n=1 Tax=Colocasia esculenta TaxID=4460 RepID=A0A843VHN9_COLES|nr:hypothetical protein [Colocasia esculenta]
MSAQSRKRSPPPRLPAPCPPSGGPLPRRRRRRFEEARRQPPHAAASSFFLFFSVLCSLFLLCKGSMNRYLYRSRSVKQPSIKQALKGVKAIANVVKGAIQGIVKWFLHAGVPAHTAESPYFQTMLDAIAEAGPGLKAPTQKWRGIG